MPLCQHASSFPCFTRTGQKASAEIKRIITTGLVISILLSGISHLCEWSKPYSSDLCTVRELICIHYSIPILYWTFISRSRSWAEHVVSCSTNWCSQRKCWTSETVANLTSLCNKIWRLVCSMPLIYSRSWLAASCADENDKIIQVPTLYAYGSITEERNYISIN